MANKAEILRLAALYKAAPEEFVEANFGVTLWGGQKRMIRSFFENPVTVVRSCHSSGKTFGLGACAVSPVIMEREAVVLTLSGKEDQLKNTVWSEVPRFIGWSRIGPLPPSQVLNWKLEPKLFLTGVVADNPTTLQGYHAERGYVLWDEIASIENGDMFGAVDSLTASGEWHVMYCMNPTRSAGPEVDLWNSPLIPDDCKITIDAFETPNFWDPEQGRFITVEELGAREARDPWLDYLGPGGQHMITRRYAWGILKSQGLGPSSDWWARVRGEFPQEDFDTLIFRHWVDDAGKRAAAKVQDEEPTMCGLDVAGPGEAETVAWLRRGPNLKGMRAWRQADPLTEIMEFVGPPREGLVINGDSAGIGFHLLKNLEHHGYRVQYINVGKSAFNRERFANAKAEFYWQLRRRFEDGDVAGEIDELTKRQLTSILYEHNDRNLVVIEPKDKARRRGVVSPDRAEALMLAFAMNPWGRGERDWVYERPLVEEPEEAPKPRAVNRWLEVMAERKKARRAAA